VRSGQFWASAAPEKSLGTEVREAVGVAADELMSDERYAPTLEYPRFSVQPGDVEFDHAVDAFLGLLRGANVGKMVVKL